MYAAVSLDGFMADDRDEVGPLFDWYGNGDVSWIFPGGDNELRTTQVTADFIPPTTGTSPAWSWAGGCST